MTLSWFERVPAISVNPDMATREDIARLAAELMEARHILDRLSVCTRITPPIHQVIVDYLNGKGRKP